MAILTPLLLALRSYRSFTAQASLELIVNFLLSISFFALRYTPYICTLLPSSTRNRPCQLDWRESEVLMFLVIFISIKNRNAISSEQAIRKSLTYAKACCVYLFYRMNIGACFIYLEFF